MLSHDHGDSRRITACTPSSIVTTRDYTHGSTRVLQRADNTQRTRSFSHSSDVKTNRRVNDSGNSKQQADFIDLTLDE